MPNARQTPVNKSHSSLGPDLRPGRLASARRTFERNDCSPMAFARTITAAGLCVWGPCSSSTFKLTAILDSTSTSAFSPRTASSLPTTLLKPSARHSRSSPTKVWHVWRPESALGLLQVGAATRAAGRARRLFCGPLPSHSCRSHRPAVFVYRARKQANVAQDLCA